MSILEFGARPNEGLQTACIQAAIDDVYLAGGGEVQVPEGLFRTGGLRLRSHVTLHLLEGAILEGSRDWRDYDIFERDTLDPVPAEKYKDPLRRWHHGLIKAIGAEDIAIIGEPGSVLDGRDCYDPEGEEDYRGPHCVNLWGCRSVTLRGYTVENSGNWAHCIHKTDIIEARNLRVFGGHDGFHVRGCNNVLVEDCVFHTGDDCIAGYANINVLIRNCEFNSSCSHLRFGGTNVLVEHCRAWGPGIYGHRYTMTKEEQAASAPTNERHRHQTLGFFTYLADLGLKTDCLPGNIIVRDVTVDCVDRFFQFNFSGSDKWQRGQALKSIRFEDMLVRDVRMPIVAYSNDEVKTILEMRNVDYTVQEGFGDIDVIQAANFERLSFHNVRFHGVTADHLIRTWDDGGIVETDGLAVDGAPKKLRIPADAPFFSADV